MREEYSPLIQREDESRYEHHKRLIHGKLLDHTLSDYDYSELALYAYGKEYSADVARRMFYGSQRTIELQELESEQTAFRAESAAILAELEDKRIELKKERQKLTDQRSAYNKLIREQARHEELCEILFDSVRNGNLPSLDYERAIIAPSDNDLLVSLNDMHYGAVVENYWRVYNPDVCRDMMRAYLDRIISIATTHKSENCIVWANGDEISGNIHYSLAVTNRENVIEQVMGVSELISEFLAELSHYFATVTYVSVAGNHSRIEPNKDKSRVDERLDDLIEWYLGARLQAFPNIIIGGGEKIDSTIYLIDVRGKTYCGVHGDFDATESKVQSLQTLARKPLYAVLSGHMHHCKVDDVQGVKTVMAGSFIGMDDYCVQRRIFGKAEQMVLVCDHTGIVCAYPVQLQ